MNGIVIPDSVAKLVGTIVILMIIQLLISALKNGFNFFKYDLKGDDRRRDSQTKTSELISNNHSQIIEILKAQNVIMERLTEHGSRVEKQSYEFIKWSMEKQLENGMFLKEIHKKVDK